MAGELDHRIAWWRPLVQWIACLPHLVVTGALSAAQLPVFVIAAVAVVATGRVPKWTARFNRRVLRHRASAFAYFFVLRTTFPPLDGDDADLSRPLPELAATAPRWSPVVRPLAVLPHVLVLAPIGLVLDLCYPAWMAAVAVNRGWPAPVERFLVAVEAWVVAIVAYVTMATGERPAFGLSAYAPTVAAWAERGTATTAARAS